MATQDHVLGLWLQRLRLRSDIGTDDLAAIAALPFEREVWQANRDFVRLGEHLNHACVIISGLAGRFDQTASGARQITALHIPGDAADLHSVPLPEATSALQALTQTEIVRIPHAALRALVAERPGVAMAFWRDCMIDGAILSKWVLNIGRASARHRVAHLLCEMAIRNALIGGSRDRFPLPATQTHLGDVLGLTNVHINRTLRSLSDDELAVVRTGQVEVLDWPGLVADADFDVHYLQLPAAMRVRLGFA